MLDLSAEQINELRRILGQRLPRHEVRAFGSRVTGRAKPHSDLDLVVMGERAVDDLAWAELKADLEESNLPFHVDLVRWPDAPDSLRSSIIKRSEVISH